MRRELDYIEDDRAALRWAIGCVTASYTAQLVAVLRFCGRLLSRPLLAVGMLLSVALALAHASKGTVSALHVFQPQDDTAMLRGRARRPGMSLLVDAHRLGKRSGVPVKGLTATNSRPETVIKRSLRGGRFDLVVLGTSLRQGETKLLGPRTASLLRGIRTPALVIAR